MMKYCLLFLTVLFASCGVNKPIHWDKATYANKSDLSIIGLLERMRHKPEPVEDTDLMLRTDTSYHQSKIKTSNVQYFEIKQKEKENWVVNKSKNNCRVYLPKSDSLVIRIGEDYIHVSGVGFKIHYSNGNFYSLPYDYESCSYNKRLLKPKYKIRQQQLVLDKEKYNVGDSIYGKIYFHISETLDYRKHNNGIVIHNEHYASGYFRAIVKKDFYW